MATTRTLLFATVGDATRSLATCLDAELSPLPGIEESKRFEQWRSEVLSGTPRDRIVVAPWIEQPLPAELVSVDTTAWRRRFELPYLLWNFALGVAGRRCADGGSLVALVQAPAAIDALDWTPECAIADGVLALVRSVAAAEGSRGVRANLVTTSPGLLKGEKLAGLSLLPVFPNALEVQVAGAIRTLLSPDASAITGRVLSTDGGRSL